MAVTQLNINDILNLQTSLNALQPTLVSGTNIKTINSTSLLGSSNILLQTPLVVGTDYLSPSGSAALLTSFPTLNQSTTGSAATLTTPRAINGTNFDGSAAITITSAAGTLTGTTLNSTVITSSLTSVGTLGGLTVTAAPTLSAMTNHSVLFTGTSGLLSQDNNNFYFATPLLSVSIAGDFSGTDAINIYGQFDAYKPNSSIGSVTSTGTTPGISASTSRGTGASPLRNNTGDLIGSHSFWSYTGVSPAYTYMAGIVGTAVGPTPGNLGGQLDFYIKADGGSQASAVTIFNNSTIQFNSGYSTGIVHSSSVGLLSSSLIVNADITNSTIDLTTKVTGLLPDGNISSATNWNTAYTNRITSLTVTGSSGASTLVSNVLNIPTYTLAGLGGVATTVTVAGFALSSNITLAALTATDTTLTFSGSYTGATARTVGLNLGNSNTWTAIQTIQTTTANQLSINYDGTHTGIFSTGSTGNLGITATASINLNSPVALNNGFSSSAARTYVAQTATSTSTTGPVIGMSIGMTYNQASGTGANTDFLVNRVETAIMSGTQLLVDLQVGGTSKFNVDRTGLVTAIGNVTAPTFLASGSTAFSSSTTTATSNMSIYGTGAIGLTNLSLLIGTASQVRFRAFMNGQSSTTISAADSYIAFGVGKSPITMPSSGTTDWLAQAAILSFGTITNASTITINNAATFYVGAAPSAATTNYTAYFDTGNVRIANGNLTLNTAGNGLLIKEGTNATMGVGTLVAGTLVVSNTKVTANSRIFLTDEGSGVLANIGALYISARSAGTSFTVSSSNALDTSTFSWIIIEPA